MSARLLAIGLFVAALLLVGCADQTEPSQGSDAVKSVIPKIQVKDAAEAIRIAQKKCAGNGPAARNTDGTWHASLHRGIWDAQFVVNGDTKELPYLEVRVTAESGKPDRCAVRVVAD
jgi:hypothetical protein